MIVRGKEASRVPLRKCTGCGIHFGPVIDLNPVMERAGESQVPAAQRPGLPGLFAAQPGPASGGAAF